MATMEEALVPLYMYHRYAVEAAASAVGGQDYIYAFRGDGRMPTKWVPAARAERRARGAGGDAEAVGAGAAEERARARSRRARRAGACTASCSRATPATRSIRSARRRSPPTSRSGSRCSPIAPRAWSRSMRSIRRCLGSSDVIDALPRRPSRRRRRIPTKQEIRRATARALVERLMWLAGGAPMPQVRAEASAALARFMGDGLPAGTRRGREQADRRRHQALPRAADRPDPHPRELRRAAGRADWRRAARLAGVAIVDNQVSGFIHQESASSTAGRSSSSTRPSSSIRARRSVLSGPTGPARPRSSG